MTVVSLESSWHAARMSIARHVITILAVSDLERSVAFYDSAFGWTRHVDTPVYVELDAGGHRLGLYQRDGFARNTQTTPAIARPGETTATEIYVHVTDLGAEVEKLSRLGARLLSIRAPRPWGDDAAYFADPDGNVLVVAAPSDA
jgi:catechol 2,3-dioxygenase-like lactoylglutathione lyase family enzyme